MAGVEDAGQPHPSPQAGGKANAAEHRPGERRQVLDPRRRRACLRHQKNRFGLFIRTIGIARAEAKLTLANIAYNFDRLIFHERARAMG